jgi:uncharacterized protein (TIGR03000 family)
MPVPAGPPAAAPAPGDSGVPVPGPTSSRTNGRAVSDYDPRIGSLEVELPANARLLVNGHEMKSKGGFRRFASEPMTAGVPYVYEVRVELPQAGHTLTKTETVRLKPGQVTSLAFNLTERNELASRISVRGPETMLKLHVPADAKVYLGGEETASAGLFREFTTNEIAPDQAWNDYEIRVEARQNGKLVTRTQKISLTAGEVREVRFDLNDASAEEMTMADNGR